MSAKGIYSEYSLYCISLRYHMVQETSSFPKFLVKITYEKRWYFWENKALTGFSLQTTIFILLKA